MSDPALIEESDAAAADLYRSRELISTTRRLLDRDRLGDEIEVILSTVLEILASGPKTLAEVHGAVNEIWPGAAVPLSQVEAAIDKGSKASLLLPVATLDEPTWALSTVALRDAEASREWFSDAMERLASQIEARALDDIGPIDRETSQLWSRYIVAALTAGIGSSDASYAGGIGVGLGGELRPLTLDGRAILARVKELDSQFDNHDFLAGCLLAAIDETETFGNEMVGHVATACVLHAVAARRTGAAAQQRLGTLAGKRMVVDTNVLFLLLGPTSSARPFERLIRDAVGAGIEVVVPEHVLDEMRDVVARVSAEHIPTLMESLRAQISTRVFIQTVNESSLADFLLACEEGRYRSWEDYLDRVRDLESELATLGIVVREHHNRDRARVQRIGKALTQEIALHGHGRSQTPIERDAESIELVWRARRAHTAAEGLWPGGWLLSTDLRIDPTYKNLERYDEVPLVLKPAQLATLLTHAVSAAEASALVTAAAAFVRQETMLGIAVRYPPETAAVLARRLATDAFSATDERVAQLSFTNVIDVVSASDAPSGDDLTSIVLARRAQRTAAAQNRQRDALRRSAQEMSESVLKARNAVTTEREARLDAERRGSSSSNELASIRQQLATQRVLEKRRIALAVTVVLAIVGIAIACMWQLWGAAAGTAVGVVILGAIGWRWVTDPDYRWSRLLLALIPEVLFVIDAARGIGLV